jgi:Flp pilus assembly protein protease CpaA
MNLLIDHQYIVRIISAVPLLALACHISVYDMLRRKVLNRTVLQLFCMALPIHLVNCWILQVSLQDFLYSMAWPIALLFVLAEGWKRGLVGGGDAKLWPVVALLMPPTLTQQVISTLGIPLCGGLLSMFYLWLRRGRHTTSRIIPPAPAGSGFWKRIIRVERRRVLRGIGVPYACAIVVAPLITVIAFPLSHLGWAGI